MEQEFETRLNSLTGLDQGVVDPNGTAAQLSSVVAARSSSQISMGSAASSVTLAKVKAILRSLTTNQASVYFRVPVDPIKLNIPNYPSIIKRPMDLQTVSKRLETGHYTTVVHPISHPHSPSTQLHLHRSS